MRAIPAPLIVAEMPPMVCGLSDGAGYSGAGHIRISGSCRRAGSEVVSGPCNKCHTYALPHSSHMTFAKVCTATGSSVMQHGLCMAAGSAEKQQHAADITLGMSYCSSCSPVHPGLELCALEARFANQSVAPRAGQLGFGCNGLPALLQFSFTQALLAYHETQKTGLRIIGACQ